MSDKKDIKITKYIKNVAREARDVVTALGTLAEAGNASAVREGASNIAKQVAEVGVAVVKNKKGTSSNRISSGDEVDERYKPIEYGKYIKGSQRK
jgi:methylaspartate ammonia-lyase